MYALWWLVGNFNTPPSTQPTRTELLFSCTPQVWLITWNNFGFMVHIRVHSGLNAQKSTETRVNFCLQGVYCFTGDVDTMQMANWSRDQIWFDYTGFREQLSICFCCWIQKFRKTGIQAFKYMYRLFDLRWYKILQRIAVHVLFDDLNNQHKCLVAVAIRSYLLV